MLENWIARSTWVLQFPHWRLTASIVLDCIQGLYNMERLCFWSHPNQGIPGRLCCCHSQTSCITDMQWWRHAYVVLQWNWTKWYPSCFVSSPEAISRKICRFYCRDAPKLSTHHIHHNTVQLSSVLLLLLHRIIKAEWSCLLGCFCRSPCLEGKNLIDNVSSLWKGFNLFMTILLLSDSLLTPFYYFVVH